MLYNSCKMLYCDVNHTCSALIHSFTFIPVTEVLFIFFYIRSKYRLTSNLMKIYLSLLRFIWRKKTKLPSNVSSTCVHAIHLRQTIEWNNEDELKKHFYRRMCTERADIHCRKKCLHFRELYMGIFNRDSYGWTKLYFYLFRIFLTLSQTHVMPLKSIQIFSLHLWWCNNRWVLEHNTIWFVLKISVVMMMPWWVCFIRILYH